MEVILLERVEKLGHIGDVVNVKNGFARNYLLPNKKALRANESNRKLFEANRSKIEADNADKRSDAEKAAKDVDGKAVKLIRQASNTGQLYGSVSARDIVEALEDEGAKVVRSQIVLDRPIKAIGVHEVKVALHPEVAVTVKVNVARSPEEADLQSQGVDVMAQMFEREPAGLADEAQQDAEPGAGDGGAAAETGADGGAEDEAGEDAGAQAAAGDTAAGAGTDSGAGDEGAPDEAEGSTETEGEAVGEDQP